MRFAIHFNPSRATRGGGHTYTESLVEELAKLVGTTKHELCLVGTGRRLPERLRLSSVRLIDLRTSGADLIVAFLLAAALRRWRWLPWVGMQRTVEYYMQARLGSILRKNGIQFLWSPTPFVHTMEIPYAITVWDLQHRVQGFFPEASYRGEWRERERHHLEMLARACYIIATNETGKREITRAYGVPPQRVLSLPHFTPGWALDPPVESAGILQSKYNLSRGRFVFYPAQFWPHKNHIRVLEALVRLNATQGRELKAVFVGADHGNKEYLLKAAQDLGLGDQVIFPGFVSRAELCWLYRNAYGLIFASMFGPENLPPLEAFALGCPVICAKYGGAQEQLADAALYFDPTDADDLASKILLLESPGLREELCQKGRLRCRLWTPRQYAERIFSLLNDFEATRRCWP